MKFAVRYYTRSGNTKKLAEAVAKAVEVTEETVAVDLTEPVDILFLGCSYYAFDMDSAVKEFIERNSDKISKIALFGTSAMMKSMKKPMEKVIEGKRIDILNREYHVKGEFGPLHKGKPDEEDVKGAMLFAKKIAEEK